MKNKHKPAPSLRMSLVARGNAIAAQLFLMKQLNEPLDKEKAQQLVSELQIIQAIVAPVK